MALPAANLWLGNRLQGFRAGRRHLNVPANPQKAPFHFPFQYQIGARIRA